MSDYFGEQIAQGKPIIPPTVEQAPLVPSSTETQTATSSVSDFVGLPVRASGDRIFLLKEGKKHWITSPEAYVSLGFKFGDEVKIDQATLSVLPDGDPIRV